jgi:hypothetical protein
MPRFLVRCELEIRASTPERATTTARDMMLGPACPFNYEVLPMEYLEEACEWFPEESHGRAASFTATTARQR